MFDRNNKQILIRRIIHIDMDAFYASVEQRENPNLKGKPVVVGGNRERGVVAAASYEARAFGIYSAMPIAIARRKCPDLIIVKPQFDLYRQISAQIRQIFAKYTEIIQPLALDEAYLDVTDVWPQWGSATALAQEIRFRIRSETGLTASAGVSYNKFLAKLASDYHKPDNFFVIPPSIGPQFVAQLPIEKLHGVGPVTAQKMQKLGIHVGLDLRKQSQDFLVKYFGKMGVYFYNIARAEDNRPVESHRLRKSLGTELTFDHNLTTLEQILVAIQPILAKLWSTYEHNIFYARTVTVKVKYSDFQVITRSYSWACLLSKQEVLFETVIELLKKQVQYNKSVRLLGVTLSNLENRENELEKTDLFSFSIKK